MIARGDTVTYHGHTWDVWDTAPGTGRWWIVRWPDPRTCIRVEAPEADLVPVNQEPDLFTDGGTA